MNTPGSMNTTNTGNRVSKHNLRDNQKSLKEYGMNIITGGKTPVPQSSNAQIISKNEVTSASNFNEMKDMIEVKTSNNYQIGKQTINSRIGEDFEPNKPMVNYPTGEAAKASQNAYGSINSS